ncbi:NUDIX domain-containing protein [Lachnospiraceae bacterium HCP1S3_C3]|nr:NUDIX hydrolase [Lachnospiraceae bacterium]MDD6858685.1 NUDIX hydrolase [Lachnospiraceae bacterium]
MEEIKRLNRELVYKGHIIDMYKDTVKIPNGNIAEWDFIGHKGAAAVLPVLKNGNVLMVRQYRNALDRYTLEIPAGGLESPDEPMIDCAARELEEETGYKSDNLEMLLSLHTTVAFCNEKIEVFLARDLVKTSQHLDEDEYIDVEEHSIEELLEAVYSGKIEDSKTVSAILSYYSKYCK